MTGPFITVHLQNPAPHDSVVLTPVLVNISNITSITGYNTVSMIKTANGMEVINCKEGLAEIIEMIPRAYT